MNQRQLERWERQVRTVARSMPYPPVPNIAPGTMQRLSTRALPERKRWRLSLAVAALLVSAIALSSPTVRAGLIEVLQIGAVRLSLSSPTPTASGGEEESLPELLLLSGLARKTTLDEARRDSPFRLRLPTYPEWMGEPDYRYRQERGDGLSYIMIWLEPGNPREIRLSLYQIGVPQWAMKRAGIAYETEVNGNGAWWVQGSHLLEVLNERGEPIWPEAQIVEGEVLIWIDGGVTYRLESGLSMEEAVRVAESLE